jgi:UTP--glucose-1-phosphate uridylyltransferase
VKTTDDLLVVRSDVYALSPRAEMLPTVAPEELPVVKLDPRFFKLVDDFDARFPAGPPSLRGCRRLVVRGDVHFGRDVVVEGSVEVAAEGDARRDVPDGAVLRGPTPPP